MTERLAVISHETNRDEAPLTDNERAFLSVEQADSWRALQHDALHGLQQDARFSGDADTTHFNEGIDDILELYLNAHGISEDNPRRDQFRRVFRIISIDKIPDNQWSTRPSERGEDIADPVNDLSGRELFAKLRDSAPAFSSPTRADTDTTDQADTLTQTPDDTTDPHDTSQIEATIDYPPEHTFRIVKGEIVEGDAKKSFAERWKDAWARSQTNRTIAAWDRRENPAETKERRGWRGKAALGAVAVGAVVAVAVTGWLRSSKNLDLDLNVFGGNTHGLDDIATVTPTHPPIDIVPSGPGGTAGGTGGTETGISTFFSGTSGTTEFSAIGGSDFGNWLGHGDGSYTVQKGDSIWRLSEKYLEARGINSPSVYQIDAVKDEVLKEFRARDVVCPNGLLRAGDIINLSK